VFVDCNGFLAQKSAAHLRCARHPKCIRWHTPRRP
jgi:hypothetical protein